MTFIVAPSGHTLYTLTFYAYKVLAVFQFLLFSFNVLPWARVR